MILLVATLVVLLRSTVSYSSDHFGAGVILGIFIGLLIAALVAVVLWALRQRKVRPTA